MKGLIKAIEVCVWRTEYEKEKGRSEGICKLLLTDLKGENIEIDIVVPLGK